MCACVYSILIKRKQDKAKRGKKKLSPSEQTAVRTRPKIWRIYTNICQVEQTQRGEMRSPGEMEKKKEYKGNHGDKHSSKTKREKVFSKKNSRTFASADDKMSIHSTKTASDDMPTLLLPHVLASNTFRM